MSQPDPAPGYTPLRTCRYERKFVADTLTPEQAAAVIEKTPLTDWMSRLVLVGQH